MNNPEKNYYDPTAKDHKGGTCGRLCRKEKITLEDGRFAERHTFVDAEGNEVEEIYTEPARQLNLQKRTVSKKKEVIAERRVQTVDGSGKVVSEEVYSTEPKIELEKRRHIVEETEDAEMAPDIEVLVAQAVEKQMAELDARKMVAQSYDFQKKEPIFSAQAAVEERVENKKKSDNNSTIVYSLIALGQVALLAYLILF